MRLAFLLDRFPQNGGVENVSIKLSNHLSNKGCNIFILAKKGDKPNLLNLLDSKINILLLDDNNYNSETISSIITKYQIEIIINQGAYPNMNKLIKKLRDKIHVRIISVLHNEPLYYFKSAVSSISKDGIKSKIKHIFKYFFLKYKFSYAIKDLIRLYEYSDSIVFLSDAYRCEFQKLIKSYVISNEGKLIVIPNPVDLDSSHSHEKKKEVVFVGRLEECQKRIFRILSIWEKVHLQFPDWRLNIVGDGPDKEKYQTWVDNKKIKTINFLGFQENMRPIYESSSILLLTSDYEGLPMVILEAMKYGCVPIIYNSFKAAEDLICSGKNGILIKPFNENDFVNSLISLLNNKELRLLMSENSTKSCTKFSTPVVIEQWLKLFNSK